MALRDRLEVDEGQTVHPELSAAPVVGSLDPGGDGRAEVPGGRMTVEDVFPRECEWGF
ncbi:hypothetical protein [Streptomyces sp. SCL15-4]|uniref:hypothetical protein n=1 Tax=Streptomyces sp. SCL15-4 TaxID=2967221 RepID=UPI0029669505|nr:hypothetical protein [Streptomyces sp. SCL15-4]